MKEKKKLKWKLVIAIGALMLALGFVGANKNSALILFLMPGIVFIIIGVILFVIQSARDKKAQAQREKELENQRRKEEAEKLRAKREAAEKLRKEQEDTFLSTIREIPEAEIIIADEPAAHRDSKELDEIKFSTVTKRTAKDKLGNFVVVDVETTGLSSIKNEIIEIAAIRYRDFLPVEKFTTLCKPKNGIPRDASAVNGITAKMVENKPLFGQVAESFHAFLGSDNIVGHNLAFDLKFLIYHGVDVLSQQRKYFDTYELSAKTLKKVKTKWNKDYQEYVANYNSDYDVENYKLETLAGYYSIPYFSAHRALADCFVTAQLFENLIDDRT